jgi:integrase
LPQHLRRGEHSLKSQRFLVAKSSEWSNAKHRQQWKNTLSQHAEKLSDLNVEEITTEDVLSVLMPIWNEIPETASRVRGRIESILDYAKVRKLREGENPASWRGNLAHVLPKRQILTRGHHRALPYTEIPEFIKTVRARNDMSAIALEITILTALRTSELINGEWSEIDFDKELWTIPAARTKAKRAHRIPLTPRIIQLLSQLHERKFNKFIFPSGKADSSLSGNAMEMLLRRLDAKNTTVHGMRSSFRDWAGDETEAQREVIEAALGHVIGDKAEAAYRRGDAMAKRRALMIAWEEYCCGSKNQANVVSLKPLKSRG